MNNISRQFEDELKALLLKYDASLELENNDRPYSSSYSFSTIKVFSDAKYDVEGNKIRDNIDLDLGSYFSSK